MRPIANVLVHDGRARAPRFRLWLSRVRLRTSKVNRTSTSGNGPSGIHRDLLEPRGLRTMVYPQVRPPLHPEESVRKIPLDWKLLRPESSFLSRCRLGARP